MVKERPNPVQYPVVKLSGRWITQYCITEYSGGFKRSSSKKPAERKNDLVTAYKHLRQTTNLLTDTLHFASSLFRLLPPNKIKTLTFPTLTLSAKQLHCDKSIKRHCFNKFLIQIQRKYNLDWWLWKAEVQKNGNLHFHILTDHFIPHVELRHLWNRCQESLGYLSWYCHNGGDLNPNSTDIHGLKNIRDAGRYIAKYMSKKDGVRQVCGRMWGCSDNIRELTRLELYMCDSLRAFLNYMYQCDHPRIFHNESMTSMYLKTYGMLDKLPPYSKSELKIIIEKNLRVLYPSQFKIAEAEMIQPVKRPVVIQSQIEFKQAWL